MSKKNLLLSVCVTLSACVVYAPTYVSEDQSTVVHYESTSTVGTNQSTPVTKQTNEVSKRVPPKATRPRDQHTLAECGAFTLPREAQKPEYLTEAKLALAQDIPELDRIVGAKMKELQTHIDNMQSKYEQAHIKWMEACNDKLLR